MSTKPEEEEITEILDKLAKREVLALTEGEVAYIKARSSYLTIDQREKFAEIFSGTKKETPQTDELSLGNLKARGEAVGLKYKVGTKKSDYLKAIIEAETNT